MADISIKISGLGKRYTIGAREEQYDTLRDRIKALRKVELGVR